MPLFHPFNEANAPVGVQFRQQLHTLVFAAVHILHNFLQRIVNIDPALFIVPAVLCGKAHPVKQKAVKKFSVCGKIFEMRACDKQFGNPVIAELLGFFTVEIGKGNRPVHRLTSIWA